MEYTMNYAELDNFIKHYMEYDKTQRAIMLTAAWGAGKSYYIQKELIPFLSKKENGNYQCIVVSLYGLSKLSEISKTIYLESRMKILNKKSEKILAGKMIAKTILKGITSFFSIDFSKSEDEEITQLYESIDLSGKLIIFEDIERSNINILDILGYVNSLVEQDEVKILLVSNEAEILKYHNSELDKDGKTICVFDDESIKYLKIKEKAVSDTIFFSCDFFEAINAIICRFNNESLNFFTSKERIEEILGIMMSKHCYNLRSLIFACQKTVDIFEKINHDDKNLEKVIFYSIIAFCLRIKNGDIPEWKDSSLVSFELGIDDYPLYRFCYDYIRWQELDQSKVTLAIESHKKFILYDRHGAKKDLDLNVLFSYYNHTEAEVSQALSNIELRLADPENIPFYDYGKLAYYLISLHTLLGYNYASCKEKMISNIKGKKEIDVEMLFFSLHDFETEAEKEQFDEFESEIKVALNDSEQVDGMFSYMPDELHLFYDRIIRDGERYYGDHRFISKFDVSKLTEMIFKCIPSQIDDFRCIMFAVYRHATSKDFLKDDLTAMLALKIAVTKKLEQINPEFDRIALRQINWMLDNLSNFIKQLSQ